MWPTGVYQLGEPLRLFRCGANLILLLALGGLPSAACSCANNTPIQASDTHYRERAVFTARVIQLMGPVYHWGGRRSSSRVLAIVHHRYWGLPWHWPAIVVLDGSYPCDIAMSVDEEYLVSGRRGRYGVLEVNVCSRTQPLASAQVDLRTLDGTRCALPGGAILGRVVQTVNQEQRPLGTPRLLTGIPTAKHIRHEVTETEFMSCFICRLARTSWNRNSEREFTLWEEDL